RGFDALAAFADRDIRHSDHACVARRARQVQVHLDIDQMSVDTVNGCAAGLKQRHRSSDLPIRQHALTSYPEAIGYTVGLSANYPRWSGGTGRRTGLKSQYKG